MGTSDWYKADNAAKIFLATHNQRDTRTLRVTVALNEQVQPELLQTALEQTIQARSQFQVIIHRGFFWHYLQRTDEIPQVSEDSGRPCPILYGPFHKGTLHYRVTYYRDRINLDIFHALSDGTGALDFLNALTLNYLRLIYGPQLDGISLHTKSSASDRNQDSFEQFYDKNNKPLPERQQRSEKAYKIRSAKLSFHQMQFFELHMSAAEILKLTKSRSITVTSYLSAQLMLAIHDDMPISRKKLPVSISMPVNLRNFYSSSTGRNFFNSVLVSHRFDGSETPETLAAEFSAQLKENLQPDRIRSQMNSYARFEHLLLARMIPLAIKQPVIRFCAKWSARRVSAVVSGLGVQRIPEELQPYIRSYSALCSYNGLFSTITTYNDTLIMGVSSIYENTNVLRNFVKRMRDDGISVQLYATDVV